MGMVFGALLGLHMFGFLLGFMHQTEIVTDWSFGL